MKNKKLLILAGSICLILVLAALPFMAACAQPAPAPAPTPTPTPAPAPAPVPTPPAEPIVLKVLSWQPQRVGVVKIYLTFVNAVNERAKGELILNYLGGSEVIPGKDQTDAVRKGVVDMTMLPIPYYDGLVPVGDIITLSELTFEEERESGAWDYIRELHEEAGLFWLGRGPGSYDSLFYLFGNTRINTLQDFVGLRGGTGSVLPKPFIEELGMSFTLLSFPEIYTSLERGLVDFYFGAATTSAVIGVYKVAKYAIDHPVYTGNLSIIMGLDSWNRLPKHLQNLLVDVYLDTEAERTHAYVEDTAKYLQMIRDGGMEFITLPEGEAEPYLEIADRTLREALVQKFPETAPKLIELMSK